LFYRKHVSH